MAESDFHEMKKWGSRTIAYVHMLVLGGRTGKIVREETEQSAISGERLAKQLWEDSETEASGISPQEIGRIFIQKVVFWASDYLRLFNEL